jgi:Rrf2 family nitric oxide-sensitive transcriptional repressor
MQLTSHTDYALRLLIYLAVYTGDGQPTVRDAAWRYDISPHHLAKVAQTLAQLGYIETQRGRGGGLMLLEDAEEINIGEMVRATENLDLVECFRPDSACAVQPACRLKNALAEAGEAFIATLEQYTLADLIGPRVRLARLLDLNARRGKA